MQGLLTKVMSIFLMLPYKYPIILRPGGMYHCLRANHVTCSHYIYTCMYICDQACENRAYQHTKFGLTFELQLTMSFDVHKVRMTMKSLCLVYKSIRKQRKFTEHKYHKHRPRKVSFSEHV